MYDKLLKPRQSFRITLYYDARPYEDQINFSASVFLTYLFMNDISSFPVK